MKTYYVFDTSARQAWFHNRAACGERTFGADVDGQYNPKHCGYVSRKTAEKAAAGLRSPQWPNDIVVFDREELFAHLELIDWAYPHLKDAPSAADRRKAARRERAAASRVVAQAERAAIKRTSLTPSRAMALL